MTIVSLNYFWSKLAMKFEKVSFYETKENFSNIFGIFFWFFFLKITGKIFPKFEFSKKNFESNQIILVIIEKQDVIIIYDSPWSTYRVTFKGF